MSQRLNFDFTASNTRWQPSRLRRSALIASVAGPAAASMVLLAASRFSADDDTITVSAPPRANSTAISRPMPRLPPVMTATFPENSPGISALPQLRREWHPGALHRGPRFDRIVPALHVGVVAEPDV